MRTPEPHLPDDVTATGLDAEVRRDLRGLQRDAAESVARHLVAAGRLVDEDPALALEHARFARTRASRIAVVREAAGITAYHAGEWAEALSELRAARRMGGGAGHLAVMADAERALGRPERALELSRGPEVRLLDRAERIELAIVAAGARRDLGERDAAVVSLQIPELDPARRDPWSARLFYAYADNLLAAGREAEALQWFVHAADADDNDETDADVRIAELTGEPLPDEGIAFLEDEDEDASETGALHEAPGVEPEPAAVGSSDAAGTKLSDTSEPGTAELHPGEVDAAGSDAAGSETAEPDTGGPVGTEADDGEPDRGGTEADAAGDATGEAAEPAAEAAAEPTAEPAAEPTAEATAPDSDAPDGAGEPDR